MYPAPSIIVFTTLSGLGFGLLAFLGAGVILPTGLAAFVWFALGYALALVGLVSCGGPAPKIDRCDGWEAIWTEKPATIDWLDANDPRLLEQIIVHDEFGQRQECW